MKKKLWSKIVSKISNRKFYPKLYRSYWYYRFHKNTFCENLCGYYTCIPNSDAGIGHQLANWIAGYWFARQFGLQFAHIPFSNFKWEFFLGFGEGEKIFEDLLNAGYVRIKLPLFNENNLEEIVLQKKIMASYGNKRVIFVAEQDQFYKNQFGVIHEIQHKFHNADARRNDILHYDSNNFNIAIHIRRGDILIGQENQNFNLLMRWQSNDYFVKILRNVLTSLEISKPSYIYLFSQGEESDFQEFSEFNNLRLCLDMNGQDSFLHMVFADVLITSKSSFSYKPALLNRNIKVCPKDFWHGYPSTKNWILVENDGSFDPTLLNQLSRGR